MKVDRINKPQDSTTAYFKSDRSRPSRFINIFLGLSFIHKIRNVWYLETVLMSWDVGITSSLVSVVRLLTPT